MSNNNNNPVYSQLDKDHINNIDSSKALEEKIYQSLKADAAFQEYVSHFRGDCQDSFTKDFASFKADYELNAQSSFLKKQIIDTHFFREAQNVIWYIQQKKLFDLQCLWRAEKIEIPEIVITHQFNYWSRNIKNCHFISPITQDEVDLLQKYLESYSYDESLFTMNDWQNYDEYKKEHLGDPNSLSMPEWYHFYNMHRGTESLLLLPDYKSEQEDEWIHIGMHINDSNNADELLDEDEEDEATNNEEEYDPLDPPPFKTPPLTAPNDKRPFMFFEYDKIGDFIDKFEDSHLKEIHNIRHGFKEYCKVEKWDRMEFNDAIATLRYAGKNYPMQPYHCWRKGIIKLAQKFTNEEIIKNLPLVFDEYNQRRKLGIGHFISQQEWEFINNKKKFTDMFVNWYYLGKQHNEKK